MCFFSPKILDHHFWFKNICVCRTELLLKIYVFYDVIWKARTESACALSPF